MMGKSAPPNGNRVKKRSNHHSIWWVSCKIVYTISSGLSDLGPVFMYKDHRWLPKFGNFVSVRRSRHLDRVHTQLSFRHPTKLRYAR